MIRFQGLLAHPQLEAFSCFTPRSAHIPRHAAAVDTSTGWLIEELSLRLAIVACPRTFNGVEGSSFASLR